MGGQVVVGLLGFFYHVRADLHGTSLEWMRNFIEGTPALAPLLFPNLALLACIGLVVLARHVPGAAPDSEPVAAPQG
jgi:hypothetical protein